jgi:PAS domain S-box-containing protein
MEQITTGILRRSSDAVVIIGLADGRVLDVNEAFFTMTGHARHELVGRPGRDLLVGLEQAADPTAVEELQELGSLRDVPVGLWTRSGELRVGDLSALVLEFEGQRDVLCTIHGVRDPTPGQRRSMAREEIDRILRSGEKGSEAVTRALQAFGSCLRWETGVLWRGTPRPDELRCGAVWHSAQLDPGQRQQLIRHATPHRMEALERVRHRGKPTWISDALDDVELFQAPVGAGELLHGWLGFPALGSDGVIGVVEFVSRETRQPDAELLGMMDDFGRRFGQLLEDVEASDVRLADQAGKVRRERWEPPPGTVPDAFRDLAGVVAAATEALERHPTLAGHVQPPVLLGDLRAGIGKLNRLLEDATQGGADGPPAAEPTASSGEATGQLPPALPTGLTLKAVSRRTGIPAATLRTWENRYGFMRPRRSPTGYRLYGEEEIARIEQVKYLVGQGVRTGVAMKAVIEEAGGIERTDEAQQPAGQHGPEENGKNAEVYRLTPRSPRDRRS